jgi:hypothetical protein
LTVLESGYNGTIDKKRRSKSTKDKEFGNVNTIGEAYKAIELQYQL